jgi:hypothetical protein
VSASRLALGGAVGFFAAFFVSSVVPTPLLWYLPRSGQVVFATAVTELGMDFYGRLLLSLGCAVVVGQLANATSRLRLRALIIATVLLFGLCVGFEFVAAAERKAVPLETP